MKTTVDTAVSQFNKFHKKFPNSINGWGAYEIKNDTIHVQSFGSYDGPVFMRDRYYLIRDSVTLEKIISGDSEKLFEERERNIFRLQPTHEKPDSLNVFSTNKRIRKKLEKNKPS